MGVAVEHLRGMLNNIGISSEVYVTPDGSRLLLLPYGARVLGLFAPNSDENFYWANRALAAADPTECFHGVGSDNPGGDRTWLAPEVDLFFPGFPDLSIHKIPADLDPGKYEIERSGQSFRFVNRFSMQSFRSRETVQLEIAKSWSAASNPLRYEEVWSRAADVEYAGYTQTTHLRLIDVSASEYGPIGTWNLVQLPHGGECFFPVHSNVMPKVYFGSVPQEDIDVSVRMIRYRMRSTGIQKIGVRAAASTGRAAYTYRTANHWILVVRNVFVDPGAEYVDVPWTSSGELGERGYAFQACSVNNASGCFSELEYHAPAVGQGTGRSEHEDVSQIWAFRGPKESIQIIGQSLLSPDFQAVGSCV
jgi:hypothetical protein